MKTYVFNHKSNKTKPIKVVAFSLDSALDRLKDSAQDYKDYRFKTTEPVVTQKTLGE